jgi:Fe-S cluster assembly protein SufD
MIATEPYRESFAELEARRAADPELVRRIRRAGLDRFHRRGWPAAKEEDWRNTNLSAISGREFAPVPAESGKARRVEGIDSIAPGVGPRAVFLDGRLVESRSGDSAEVSIRPLSDVLRREPGTVESLLARLSSSNDPFVMLNDAFLEEGVLLDVAPGCVASSPVHLVYVSTGRSGALASVRNFVRAGESSQLTLVETFVGTDSGPSGEPVLTNAVTQIEAGANSSLEHLKIQRDSAEALHVGTLAVAQRRDSRVTSHVFSFGGALARNNVLVALEEEGAECTLNGLFLTSGSQRVDNFTVIDHAKPHGTSRELYKGVLDDSSRGAFTGRIFVRPDAQKTDAQQANKNLILSREALVNSTPQLEIRANDVKCKHGATTGQLDTDAIFYLRSRGISEEASRNLLTYAFASELVGRVGQPELRRAVDSVLHTRLPLAPGLVPEIGSWS